MKDSELKAEGVALAIEKLKTSPKYPLMTSAVAELKELEKSLRKAEMTCWSCGENLFRTHVEENEGHCPRCQKQLIVERDDADES